MADLEAKPKGDEFKSYLVQGARFSTQYEFPFLLKSNAKSTQAIPFDKASRQPVHDQWIHFYIYDRYFECVWNNPQQYLPLFKRFEGVITPDFSLYRELPLAMQIWNTYRGRAIGYWLQSNGIPIIPNVRWGDERTYTFAFEGLEQGGSVAVSTNGCIQSKLERNYFKNGLTKMIEALSPETIINYSYAPEDIFGDCRKQGIKVISIENYAITVRRVVV